ncbi:DUF6266 family protein [Sphingobacterium tabacisoli]|uniref:DUF6266 family protein n=1 Tax=Sphingobacterium tabacisoli TaxID=2044855 RepID=A0ABW5L1Y0_9SPHI|nr:DUF6266 family protein [Sphingobacterium tabacisoli]
MGRTENGPMGSASGKVGPLVYYRWKDKDCVRSIPRVNKKRKLSDDEKKNRGKFGLAQNFLSPLSAVVRLGFHNYKQNQTAFNSAMSYTLTNAVQSDDDGFYIDHSLFHISKGITSPLEDVTLAYEEGVVTCNWNYNPTIVRDLELASFRSLFVAIPDSDKNSILGHILNKKLEDKHEQIHISPSSNGEVYHIHLGFVAVDHSDRIIDSIYVGTVIA